MSGATHTPAPWRTEEDQFSIQVIGPEGSAPSDVSSDPRSRLIVAAIVVNSQARPNAALIQHAPDLLEALEGALEALELAGLATGGKTPFDLAATAAREAITKATGKEPERSWLTLGPLEYCYELWRFGVYPTSAALMRSGRCSSRTEARRVVDQWVAEGCRTARVSA